MNRRIAIGIMVAALAATLSAGDLPGQRAEDERALVTTVVMQARKALFEQSQLDRARELAQQQLRENAGDVEALFIEMEAAALEADGSAEMNAALKLCELRSAKRDPRVTIAAARVLNLAAHTEDFRAAIPRIQAILARRPAHPHAGYFRAALLAAAADGAPGISMEKVARESGLMTEWRLAGPFGHYANLEFDQHWAPEHDGLMQPFSDGHAVERFHFDDGFLRLPVYFPSEGVLYAAGEIASSGPRTIRVESPGTLEVMVDGAVVLRKDDRFRITPEIAWRTVRLRAGSHRVVVKFLASAAPFRVTFVPSVPESPEKPRARIEYAPEAAYVAAAQKYWAGDYNGVITDLESARTNGPAAAEFLLYRAWTHVADDSPEAAAMLNATVAAAPAAMAAEYELASRAYAADRTDEALERLRRVLTTRESFVAGQELMAQIAIRLNWPVLAEKALEVPLRVHPSCTVLMQAYKFFAGHAQYERARDMRRRLAGCAPDTLAYVRTLGESGEHEKAAEAAEAVVARRPLDRSARETLVRELALAGLGEQAQAASQQLATLAPNSDRYRRMAALTSMDALLDDGNMRSSEFGQREAFFAKYRRDGVQMVRKTAHRKFSGGPAVVLVDDRVARLRDDGSVSVYVHKLTRVLDRDGIEKYGEAEVPRGAEVLELRTIKADGGVAEPEITPQKATISMPALAAGDAIDLEYVIHFGDGGGISEHPKAFQHTFGSFAAPVLYSRFVAMAPASDASIGADVAAGIAPARIEMAGNARVRIWEKDDIPQAVEEIATAHGDVLPVVRLQTEMRGGWSEVRDRFRNDLLDALRIGPRVERVATRLRSQDAQAKARELFRAIASSVRSSGSFNPDDMTSAEETLAGRSGSRTIAVLAVARAAGLDADLVLARNAGAVVRGTRAALGVFTRPLIKFRFADGRQVFADAETEGLAFGAIPPTIERHDALVIPAGREDAPLVATTIIGLPPNAEEQSVAEGDVTVESDGSLSADVTIRMGAWRSAQMRSILAGIEPAQRPRFFQQLAARIFAGAEEVTGTAQNERDPDRPLQLVLHCRAPHYVNLQSSADLDQLVPILGLKKMYPGASRKFPLFIDTPLVETANFRVHLPAGVRVQRGAPEFSASGAFGSYSLTLRQPSPDTLDIQRAFRIPVQVITPERFPEFSVFAARIEDAERQRITLAKN